jgi:hypothetical protein
VPRSDAVLREAGRNINETGVTYLWICTEKSSFDGNSYPFFRSENWAKPIDKVA